MPRFPSQLCSPSVLILQRRVPPFVCDTDNLHSNCLDRFKNAYGMISPSTSGLTPPPNNEPAPEENCKPCCPLCRGEVNGWVIIEKARLHLDVKKRRCEEEQCSFMGTHLELQVHAQIEHPHSCPSKIDPARQLDWENFQQSSEIIDVLSTIYSEVPRGVVLGDYVIEYGGDHTGDEFDDFRRDGGNWWTPCILYQVFDNIRNSRHRRRSRVGDTRRGNRPVRYDTTTSDEGSVASVEYGDYEINDEFVSPKGPSRGSSGSSNHRSWRRRSRFYDN